MENIDISLIIAQLINFLLIFFLFKKFIAVHLNKMIESRNATVEKVQNFEAYYDTRIQELKEQESTIQQQAKKEAHALLAQAENISQKKAQDILERANQEVKMILDGGKRQLEKERFQMIEDSRAYITGLAFKINQKLLGTQGVSKEFIEQELKKI